MKKVLLLTIAALAAVTSFAQHRADRQDLTDPASSTLILFGDPQGYVKYDINQPIFELTTLWVADNVEHLNIKAVLCTGDLVEQNENNALNRNMLYASELGVDMGMFYKRRDYSKIVDGRNPIVAHEYLGNSVEGKDVFIADDIISSGESVLDIAYELKKRGAKRIFAYATYSIFTNGLEKFDKAYADGFISGVFGTNLTYCSPALLERKWFHQVDVSKYVAYFIASINHDVSISTVIDPHERIEHLLEQHN